MNKWDREKDIQKGILKYLKSFPGSLFDKRPASSFGVSGVLDIVGTCPQLKGRHVEIEVKRPGRFPTHLQAKRIDDVRNAAGLACCVDSLLVMKSTMEKWINEASSERQ